MERIKLKDPGLYGMEMQKRIDESEDEGYRTYVVAVDDVLATYRETVAADQVKKAPSGNRYWTPEQLEWRRQEHAAAAWATIQAMPQLQQLDTVISDLQGRLEKRGIPIHNDRRLATIEREIEPMLHDVLQIRDRIRTAMHQGDRETVDLIMTWPGHGSG